MKKVAWTPEQIELLKQMTYDDKPNDVIAKAVGKTVASVHHKRSHLGLTIAAVAAAKAKEEAVPAVKGTPEKPVAKKPEPAPEAVPEDKPEPVSVGSEPDGPKVYSYTTRITATKEDIIRGLYRCTASRCDSCGLNEENHCRSILMTLAAQALADNA